MIKQTITKIAEYDISNSNDGFTLIVSKIEANYGDNYAIIFQGLVFGYLMTNSSPNFVFKNEIYWDNAEQIVFDKSIKYLESITSNFKITKVNAG